MNANAKDLNSEEIVVTFTRDQTGNIQGNVLHDCGKFSLPRRFGGLAWVARRKIVFIFGYKPEKLPVWQGLLPPIGVSNWRVKVEQDTRPDHAGQGVLKVRLVENLTEKGNLEFARRQEVVHRIWEFFPLGPKHVRLAQAEGVRELAACVRTWRVYDSLLVMAEWKSWNRSSALPSNRLILGHIFWDKFSVDITVGLLDPIKCLQAAVVWIDGLEAGEGFSHLGKHDFMCRDCGLEFRPPKLAFELWEKAGGELICRWCGQHSSVVPRR